MFAFIENCLIHQKQTDTPISPESPKRAIRNHDSLKYLKVQQQLIENQIKNLCLSMNVEQRAMAGKEVESILQPIVTMLIEKRPKFPIDTPWLEGKIGYIRNLI